MRLHTGKGGIFAECDLEHQGPGAGDKRIRVVGGSVKLVVKELRTRVGAWAGENARRTLGNSPYSCEYFKYGRFE